MSESASVRLLVVANANVSDPEVRDRLARVVGDRRGQAWVVAPALTASPLNRAAGEVDTDIDAARSRLKESVDTLRELGLDADGEVGDSDPSLAMEDALRRFAADEVVIAVRPADEGRWLERDVLDKSPDALQRPVTQIVARPQAQGGDGDGVEAVERRSPGEGEAEDDHVAAPEYGLPPMPRRFAAALLLSIVGTIVLFILAIVCSGDISQESMSASCAVRIGLAILGLIVSVFHGVALLVFSGVGYEGRWARIAADTILFGMPVAIVVSLLVNA
jgi:hypothetical protein